MSDYIPIKIPKELADEMDHLVGTRGFKSRGEIAKEAIRRFLDERQTLSHSQKEAA